MRYIVRKGLIAIFIMSMIMLVACGENDSSKEVNKDTTNETQENSETTNVDADEQKDEKKETDDEKEDTSQTNVSPSSIENILKKSAEAMKQVNTMKLTGEIESMDDFSGIITHSTSEVTGEVSMEPWIQYMKMHSIEETNGVVEEIESEIYFTDDIMYMWGSDDSDGWMAIEPTDDSGLADMTARMTDTHLEYFASMHDLFELSESGDAYIISFSGEGEAFKEVAFGVMKEIGGDEMYEAFTSRVTDISGTYEMTISKDTFYIVGLMMDTEQTMDMDAFKIISEERNHYQYSNFNEMDAVSVPDDVIENAEVLSMPDMSDF